MVETEKKLTPAEIGAPSQGDPARAAKSVNTRRAYAADWKHFSAWCRRQNLSPLLPDGKIVGLYITACASGTLTAIGKDDRKPNAVSTIERRLSSLAWNFSQRGQALDRNDRDIATVMSGFRDTHARRPVQKEVVTPEDILAMLSTLERGTLRGIRDRAMLLIGFHGGLRRSQIVGLDVQKGQTEDGCGWVQILDTGLLITVRGKGGWHDVEIARGASDTSCPVKALEVWLTFAKIAHGPLFRRVTGKGKSVGADRLNGQEVARLVKRTALAAGVRGNLSEDQRAFRFSGRSLRARRSSSNEV
jgi:integrase